MSKISIKLDEKSDKNRIRTIYYGERKGDEWIVLDKTALPKITENNVSIKYFYDETEETITVETEKNEDDELI